MKAHVEKALEAISSIQKDDLNKGRTVVHKFERAKESLEAAVANLRGGAKKQLQIAVNSCESVLGAFDEGLSVEDIGGVRKELKQQLTAYLESVASEVAADVADKATSVMRMDQVMDRVADVLQKNSKHRAKLPTAKDAEKFVVLRVPVIPIIESAANITSLAKAGIKADYIGGFSEAYGSEYVAGYFVFHNQIVMAVNTASVKEQGYDSAHDFARRMIPKLSKAAGTPLQLMDGSTTHRASKGFVYFWYLPDNIVDRLGRVGGHLLITEWGLGF